jgi:hypothetical protein
MLSNRNSKPDPLYAISVLRMRQIEQSQVDCRTEAWKLREGKTLLAASVSGKTKGVI